MLLFVGWPDLPTQSTSISTILHIAHLRLNILKEVKNLD